MSESTALTFAGAFFEILGLAFAALGFHSTWKSFRDTEDRFMAPVGAALDRMTQWMNRLFRVKPYVRTASGEAHLTLGLALNASGRVTWAALPSPEIDLQQFSVAVDERLGELRDEIQSLQFQVLDESKVASDHADAVRQSLDDFRTEMRTTIKSITVGGLLEQAAGWLLVLIGVVLQTWGQVA